MRINTRSSLNRAAEDIGVFFGILEQGAQMTDNLETHTLLVAAGQCRRGEGLGDEVGSPSSQFDIGIGTGERQDTDHDLRVVGLRVAEYGFLGFVQLLELVAHGLHVGGRHDGRQEAEQWGSQQAETWKWEAQVWDGPPSFYSTGFWVDGYDGGVYRPRTVDG